MSLFESDCEYQLRLIGSSFPTEASQGRLLSWIHRLVTFLGLRTLWQKNFYGLKMQVTQWHRQGQSAEALNAIVEWLNDQHFGKQNAKKWWTLMRMAVSLVQDLPQSHHNAHYEKIKELLKISKTAPQPWQGYDVAYGFAMLSLWALRQGKTQSAIDKIHIAIHADPSWGVPEYLLGCYGLLLEGIDPVEHFVRAIDKDPRYFQQFIQDPLVEQFPEVIKTVKETLSKKK